MFLSVMLANAGDLQMAREPRSTSASSSWRGRGRRRPGSGDLGGSAWDGCRSDRRVQARRPSPRGDVSGRGVVRPASFGRLFLVCLGETHRRAASVQGRDFAQPDIPGALWEGGSLNVFADGRPARVQHHRRFEVGPDRRTGLGTISTPARSSMLVVESTMPRFAWSMRFGQRCSRHELFNVVEANTRDPTKRSLWVSSIPIHWRLTRASRGLSISSTDAATSLRSL